MTGWIWPFDGIQEWLEGLWDWIMEAASYAVSIVSDWVWSAVEWVFDSISAVIDVIKGAIIGAVNVVGSVITGVINVLATAVNDFFAALWGFLEAGWAWINSAISGVIDWLWEGIQNAFTFLGEVVVGLIGGLFESLVGLAGDILEGFAAVLGPALEWIWTTLSSAAGTIAEGIMTIVDTISTSLEPVIEPLIMRMLGGLTTALSPDSPSIEIAVASQEFADSVLDVFSSSIPLSHGSPPSIEDLTEGAVETITQFTSGYVMTSLLSMGMDLVHPMKSLGFKAVVMDILHAYNVADVIGPLVQAEIWAGLVSPMRMRYNQQFPYSVPADRFLPDAAAKGVLSDEKYIEAMSYHAIDADWAKIMKAGEAEVPFFNDLREMFARGAITEEVFREGLRFDKYSDEFIAGYSQIINEIPYFKDLSQMLWRGFISEENMKESLKFLKYDKTTIDGFMGLTELIPGLSDLIRIAVRESYPDEGLVTAEDHFGKMTEWVAKQGYTDYWAKALWGAHWIIPSQSQADELLHRGNITPEEHYSLYILNDVDPDYIDLLQGIRWDLPGGIQARWLYRHNIWDRAKIIENLGHGGLAEEYREDVADAIIRNQYLSEIGKTRDNIKADYAQGFLTEDAARAALIAMRMPEMWVDYHLADAVDDADRAFKKEQIKMHLKAFEKDIINEDDLRTYLAQYIVRPELVEQEVMALKLKLQPKPKVS